MFDSTPGLLRDELRRKARWAAPLLVTLAISAVVFPEGLQAAVFRVDGVSGSDGPTCGSEGSPCATIHQAVDLSSSGDTILVAEGTYVDNVICTDGDAVVCVDGKSLTISGGFAPPDWSLPDPDTNLTIIDGQSTRRGVFVRQATFTLKGFTVRNARAEEGTHTFGGGLKAKFTDLTLQDMVFEDNVAMGGTEETGGQGGGGGAAILAGSSDIRSASLKRVVFRNNQATGGSGTGNVAGLGGGLVVQYATVSALDLVFDGNTVTGGGSSSAGKDGLGGGAAFSFGTTGTLREVTATGNSATGASASSTAGSAFGGGIFLEGGDSAQTDQTVADETSLTILDSTFTNNTSTGGDAPTPRGGVGGGIAVFTADLTLERSTVIGNAGVGGTDTDDPAKASAGGGGLFFEWRYESTAPLNVVRNTIVAENTIDGSQGGGGGIRLLGARAHVIHSTVVDNRILDTGLGNGILVGPRFLTSKESFLDLDYSIVADHTVPEGARALHVQETDTLGSTANLEDPSHFAGNNHHTNCGSLTVGSCVGFPGSNIFDSSSGFFVDPANSDYHIDGTSPPTDAASGSSEALDLDGANRSGTRDMGADEFGAVAFALSVAKIGVGDGTVTSSPSGIDCGADCFEYFAENTTVDLTATPDSGFYFTGWSGDADCSDGTVLMSQDLECTAQFEDQPPECTVADDDLVLENQTVNSTVTEEACNSITARNYTVGSSGDVTFRSPTIILDDGFTVEGTFTAINEVP